jgi:23S rRNA pseudouridine1911/1915/1917 synthase
MAAFTVDPYDAGTRVDAWLAERMEALSRARIQSLIDCGDVLVNEAEIKRNYVLKAGDMISVIVPEAVAIEIEAQDIALAILHEDSDIIVLDKAPGMVVHPSAGHWSGTLVNALLYHCEDLRGIGGEIRPGIVHRLDKETSGVLVVAKNEQALRHLSLQFKHRETRKKYLTLVWEHPIPASATIQTTIGRNPNNRKKMGVNMDGGRHAVSTYRTVETYPHHAFLEVDIKTGRTHQIRVHMAHIGHPVVGDRVYGKRRLKELPAPVDRHMLHAAELEIRHPQTNELLNFVAPIPDDMQNLIKCLRME